jgi:hypothetical protein
MFTAKNIASRYGFGSSAFSTAARCSTGVKVRTTTLGDMTPETHSASPTTARNRRVPVFMDGRRSAPWMSSEVLMYDSDITRPTMAYSWTPMAPADGSRRAEDPVADHVHWDGGGGDEHQDGDQRGRPEAEVNDGDADSAQPVEAPWQRHPGREAEAKGDREVEREHHGDARRKHGPGLPCRVERVHR